MDRDRSDIDTPVTRHAAADGAPGGRSLRDVVDALDVRAPDTLRRAVEREVAAAPVRRGAAAVAARGLRARVGTRAGSEAAGGAARRGLRARLAARPLALAAGGLAALAVALVLVLSAGGGSPSSTSVQEAARVALLPAAAPAPPARPGGDVLAAQVDGIVFPTWTQVGLRVAGQRTDTLGGHAIRTILYADRRGGRIGYAIAAGDALPVRGGRVVVRRGAQLRLLAVDGATVVTWRRDGHTCILAGRGVAPGRLLTLASYAT